MGFSCEITREFTRIHVKSRENRVRFISEKWAEVVIFDFLDFLLKALKVRETSVKTCTFEKSVIFT